MIKKKKTMRNWFMNYFFDGEDDFKQYVKEYKAWVKGWFGK